MVELVPILRGFNHFEARLYDARIMRWNVPDPAGQFWSPYNGMGNNPISGIDPDGRYKYLAQAWVANLFFGGNGTGGIKGNYFFSKSLGGSEAGVTPIYSSPFYARGNLRFDYGIQGGVNVNALGGKISLFGEFETKPWAELSAEWDFGDTQGERWKTDIVSPSDMVWSDQIKTSFDIAGLVGISKEYTLGQPGKTFDVGYKSSKSLSIPLIGTNSVEYIDPHGQIGEITHSWGVGIKAAALIGVKANVEFGFKLN